MANRAVSGDGSNTVLAPPFRALLGTPAIAGDDRVTSRELAEPQDNDGRGQFPAVPGHEIVAELGRGGMGVVYKARQRSLNRWVALKLIRAGAQDDAAARRRFRTEAEAVARLQHPNVVQIHEIAEHDGGPFLSLEYVRGCNLAQRIAGTARPDREAAALVETVARAVHYTHRRGILHRDLKPSNILLTADGSPKITDFGLAKLADRSSRTRTDVVAGTPNYMSPEQASGDLKRIGVPADVYSLGAILYELLTGQPPFEGPTALNTLEQVRNQVPPPPSRRRNGISRDLETICIKCLEKDPDRRYPSAEALADDLRRFQNGEPVRARPIPVWRQAWRSLRRRPALVVGTLVAMFLGCALLAAGSYSRVADQLTRQRAEERYRKFVEQRNEAFFYGLLATDEGALFLGKPAALNLKAARAAAREALTLAGVEPNSDAPAVDPTFAATRRAEIAADCYTLLLVLAGIEAEQPIRAAADKRQCRETVQLLECARKLGTQTRSDAVRRADLLERLGEHEQAKVAKDEAGSIAPIGAPDHFLTGVEQYRRGERAQAKISFHRALAQRPDHFWAQFFLAVCQLQSRDWEAAKAGLNFCLGRQPDFVWAYLFRSFANERLQARQDAETDFQTALRLDPNDDARYALFLTRGILRFDQKEWDRAGADFRAAIALNPGRYNAYLNLAHVHLALGQYEQAAAQAAAALRFDPPARAMFGYHVESARRLLRDERIDEALRACDVAARLAPGEPLTYVVRARALLALGRHQEAEAEFDRYLQNGGEATPDVFRGRGLARMKLRKYPEAAEDYSRALERAPDAELYQHRGWAHFFADAWKLAARDFSVAVEMDPEAGDAYVGRGLARVMLGDWRPAIADAETALARTPNTPEMMHNIACIFAQAAARAEETGHDEAGDYRGRALDAVRQALSMLRLADRQSFWRDKVLRDSALTPVRDDARFEALRQQIESLH
jgi:tetratricopeptide (TPR) repeat protein/tRNA A-37 threonylcarbamoyl transferase component Bud32